jgi:hypothetical protein
MFSTVVIVILVLAFFITSLKVSGSKMVQIKICKNKTILLAFMGLLVVYFMCYTSLWIQVFSDVHVAQSFVFCVVFCRSLFVLFSWPLHCLSFDIRLLITHLLSSNLTFQSFDLDRTLWMLFQKHAMRTKLEIYIFSTINDLQNTTQKTKDWATWTSLKTVGELRCPGMVTRSIQLRDFISVNYFFYQGPAGLLTFNF